MTHEPVLRKLKADLDDLKVRSPEKYEAREQELRRLQHKTNFDVSAAPAFRKFEKMR